ncbi:phospholipase D-like domain-containing protein [Pseudomonas sp. 10S4]|uniref:phospholipase D-like domain-containing protein n=2 Tax=Pseudomonas sp. 10S4 TaxID=3048583 RepID=UPI002B224AD1|nr:MULTISPECIES: phospholipase D-like domain-containing protein [unclassified Pseudomonas]MEB0222899.1 phospholipase D-like domain-containing protein [Pseudomonas sp. 5S1]MEB0293056.1 phospholipase D-like domain-containing protein [Pseudomonas sp. 10S4]
MKLLLNGYDSGHGDEIIGLLANAEHLECMVAFAKSSASETILEPLKQAIARGMTARMAVGLSLFVTDPAMLYELFKLEKNSQNKLELYMSSTEETFHPKVYAVREPGGHRVIVGSANMTAGGFSNNYEASVLVNDRDGALMASIQEHFGGLIEEGALARATMPRINEYAKLYAVHEAWRKMASRRAEKICRGDMHSLEVLADWLADMKADDSPCGFTAQQTYRARDRLIARRRVKEIAGLGKVTRDTFLEAYEGLLGCFHSGGLHRGKGIVSQKSNLVISALAELLELKRATPAEAFELLHSHFEDIERAGINVLTEILHALDNKRFGVMNRNAVSGLIVAGYDQYPLRPLKTNVTPELYEQFCRDVREVQTQLELENLSELDALFNYVYWLND